MSLTPGVIQPWEEGLRTDPAAGTFEWWYCDAHLEDGSTLTVEFHTKPPFISPKSPLTPFVLLTLTRPDGMRTDKTCTAEPSAFSASSERCDVVIGGNTFRGEQGKYLVHVEIDDVVLDLELTAQVPPWRPATGHAFFGAQEEHYIAWLPVVARGSVLATLTADGTTRTLTGSGYHDHNWGNIAPRKVLDHWYWGRARIGAYTVVTLMFVSHEQYDKAKLPAVLVAHNDEFLVSAVGDAAVTFTERDVRVHPSTHVPVGAHLEYQVADDAHTYTVSFQHEQDTFLLDFGTAGAYHRFLGAVSLSRRGAGSTDTVQGRALWELLHFAPKKPADEADPLSGSGHIPPVGHQA
ncbi:lipocalin-like domain-containing protein [Streptomyces olivochromogenes]|uniref:lipocalin-like domain-containing protein n=1 Tax=Streptomyces olivochromogenes TaxID=1963 RepID=UPI001F207F05|nr:lipocalin-like domain-containing protein [Streptomyces olivochromogenes]MCF3133827.1 hydroxyneurosporene dehydrogenase [Streptomyces olivochromogenes]